MVKLVYDKNNCCGCPPEMGCMGRFCPQCWETVITCDICKQETDEVWKVGKDDYCQSCFDTYIKETYVHVTYDNAEDFIDETDDR